MSCQEGICLPMREPGPRQFAGVRVHMIGIGGSGMAGMACMLSDLGAVVSGSDMVAFSGLGDLTARGVRVAIGHRVELVTADIDLVVMSAAIPDRNVELRAARSAGMCVLKYAELLGVLMRGRVGVAVAGTHGKSTTTAMTAHVLKEAGLAPSFVGGARSAQLGGSSGVGSGRHIVVEACEFDRSFLQLHPKIAAILNIEADHLDCFGDMQGVVEAFGAFAAQVDGEGTLIVPARDGHALEVVGRAKARVETFGEAKEADWRAVHVEEHGGCYRFDVYYGRARLLTAELSVAGRHNVLNALAATALAFHAGADIDRLAHGVGSFAGIDRRLTWRGMGRGVTIVDDYAHHPTAVRVTVDATRRRYAPSRLWVVFQPHQAGRTRDFLTEFAGSLAGVDEVIIPDIFGAREQGAVDGGESAEAAGAKSLVSQIHDRGGCARYMPTLQAVAEHLDAHVAEGDVVLTMGAGDVWKVADDLVERICGSDRA